MLNSSNQEIITNINCLFQSIKNIDLKDNQNDELIKIHLKKTN